MSKNIRETVVAADDAPSFSISTVKVVRDSTRYNLTDLPGWSIGEQIDRDIHAAIERHEELQELCVEFSPELWKYISGRS